MGKRRKYLNKYRFVFKSGIEEDTFDYLKRRQKPLGFEARYESEQLDYQLEGTYTPDFVLTFPDGHKRYIETKGYLDENARRKMVAVRKSNPDKDIRILFVRDNPLRKGAKQTYSAWAERIGYPWAIKTIPEEWLIRENAGG